MANIPVARDLQSQQYKHDMKNHFDIISLSRVDRLKHYGLHFAKYSGRLVRGENEKIPVRRTAVDILLVCLSSANALNQKLVFDSSVPASILNYTDYSGRFCDACEKIDHLENFREIALEANQNIFSWVLIFFEENNINIEDSLRDRRRELEDRLPYSV
ncbi:hypothetical protein [Larsenimonas salina]|uniref:hypothetical protein n=1 Tax=Larsenimonas salina TaxID=1295565 RepID=UPI00207379BF|nr:hypothetical protein [Larsenimonas salina]MCM5705332.1 hypothetical protein [Larsenimonas salina]